MLSASVVKGKIYVIGGQTSPYFGAGITSVVTEYDPATNSWRRRANMPTARSLLSTCVVEDKIYAIGDYPWGSASTTVEVYDPATDTWERKDDMPVPMAHRAGVVNGKIYLIGDRQVYIYDPSTDTWSMGVDRPGVPRSVAALAVAGGKIYSIGGGDESNGDESGISVSSVEAYDPATDTWTRKTNLPAPTKSAAAVVVGGRIYVIGGGFDSPRSDANRTFTNYSDVIVYDPETDTWTYAPSMSTARRNLAACVVDGIIYAMGGFQILSGTAPTFKTMEALDLNPVVDFNGDEIVNISDLLRLTESWGLDDPLVDIGPLPWGDGIVDARDLLVLAEYMVEYDSNVNVNQ
jgi:N-acetylneuraminic acid mutarotase